ncbi:hypothetical protein H4Q26_003764 [Puccinia striiformis f. sp. tritici PST-130]|nr:hypothetical protein H4Q26_003764 [Puccinia striiformis f. sp. tritici PST-130]
MPSHLRNGRDLSGEQRRRYVEAGVANPTGQRPVQRVERQSPVCQSGSDERPRSEPRSGSDTRQLQSDLLALRLGMSTPVPLPVDRLTVPPTDLPASENQDSHSNQGSTSPTASNQTPIVDNQALEMYINMFHAQRNMYEGARKTDDLIVMRAASLQAVSSKSSSIECWATTR